MDEGLIGCACVGMDAGDGYFRGDRSWQGHSPAARAAIPALKGQDNSAQGNALVVLHKSRSGRFLDPSGAVIPWPLRPRVALRSTRGYIPWLLRGRRHRCQASSAGGRRHSGRLATQWETGATRLTVRSSPRMGRWIVATGGVRHRRTEPVVIHALAQPPRRVGGGPAGQRLIPPVDQNRDV